MRPVVPLLVFFSGFLLSDTCNAERQYSSNTLNRILKVDTRLAETNPLISSRSISNNDNGNHGSPINSPKPNSVEDKGHCTVGETIAECSCSRGFQQCIPPGRLLRRSCSENYVFDGSIKRCRLLSQMPECSRNPVPHAETKPVVKPHHAPTKTVKTVIDTVEYLLPERPRVLYVRPAFDAFAVPTYPAGGDPFVYNAPTYPAEHSFNTQGQSPWQLDAFEAYIPPRTGFSPFGTPFYTPNVHDAFDVPYYQTDPYFPNSVPRYGEFQRDGKIWLMDVEKLAQKDGQKNVKEPFEKVILFPKDKPDVSQIALEGPETEKPADRSGADGTASTEKKINVPRTEVGLESEKSALPPKVEEGNRQDQGEGDGHSNQMEAEGDNRQDQGEMDGHSNQAEEDERRGQPTESETNEEGTGLDKLVSPYDDDVTHPSADKPVLPEVNKLALSPKPAESIDRTENSFKREQDQEMGQERSEPEKLDVQAAVQTDEENEGSSEQINPPQLLDDRSPPSEVNESPSSQDQDKVFEDEFKGNTAVPEKDEAPPSEKKDETSAPETKDDTLRRTGEEAVEKANDKGSLDETITEGSSDEAVKIATEGPRDEVDKTTTEGPRDEAEKTTTEGVTTDADVGSFNKSVSDADAKVEKTVEEEPSLNKRDRRDVSVEKGVTTDADMGSFNKSLSYAAAEVEKTLMEEESPLNKQDRRDVSVEKDTSGEVHDAGNKVTFLPDPDDCRRFYVPIMDQWIPFTCSGWTVFNPATGLCDLPENVPNCKTWNP